MTPRPYELATPEQKQPGSPWWCVHHQVRLEPLTEPIENRVRYIRENKFEHEVETRLRAMRPVTGALPEPVQRVNAEWQRVVAEWQRVVAEWQRVYAELQRVDAERQRVYAEHAAEIDALWAAECADVPWGPDGLIFTEVAK